MMPQMTNADRGDEKARKPRATAKDKRGIWLKGEYEDIMSLEREV